jgi:hypothetical protein
MHLINSFVEDMEGFLGVKRTLISLADMWRESGPEVVQEKEISEYLRTVSLDYGALSISPYQVIEMLARQRPCLTIRMLARF